MPRCPHCSRVNPPAALFCCHDGCPLGDAASVAARQERFPAPFVFPNGRVCGSYDELTMACLDDWPAAVELLQDGTLATFLRHLGRTDLALVAGHGAAWVREGDRGLDDLLRQLPTGVLRPAKVHVEPDGLDLGQMRVGQDGRAELRIVNEGMGLLHGTITSDVPWLGVGEGESSRHFRCLHETTIDLCVRGRALRAGPQPQVGRLTVASSGGEAVVDVLLDVPSTVFAAGVLAGAGTPRQLADKARLNPREAARHFESGAVARWYAENGWTYPVEGDLAIGVASVQQFFDALGLATVPLLQLSETSLALTGAEGEVIRHTLRLYTQESRPVYAHAESDQAWLAVRGIDLDGSAAEIHLSVPEVPASEVALHATLTVTGNGRERFDVPVTLRVTRRASGSPAHADPRSNRAAYSTGSLPEWIPVQLPQLIEAPPPTPAPRPRRRKAAVVAVAGLVALLGVGGLVFALAQSRKAEPVASREEEPEPANVEEPAPPPIVKVEGAKSTKEDPPVSLSPARPTDAIVAALPRRPKEVRLPEARMVPVEVVFCLDTTGSMGGLLDGAKKKIWAMCNQIAGGRPIPDLKVGLVAYRDRKDEYVTKLTPLTRDLDELHARLQELTAEGGGDFPESVNQALDEAVTKMAWSKDRQTMRLIFLVGDAPPHMDYNDDVKYPDTCMSALARGILINTVQCGVDFKCKRAWEDIAKLSGGEYVAIAQDGGVVSATTPEDGPIAELGRQLFDTALLYSDQESIRRAEKMLAAARALTGPAAADRAAFAAKSKRISPVDLLEAIEAKRVKLDDVPPHQLPRALRELQTEAEQRAYLEKVSFQRESLRTRILELEKKRAASMKAGREAKDGFDLKVLEVLRKQAKTFGIDY